MKRSLISVFAALFLPFAFASAASTAGTPLSRMKSFAPAHIPSIRLQNSGTGTKLSPARKTRPRLIPFQGASVPLSGFHFLASEELASGAPGYSTAVVGDYNGDGKKDVAAVVSADFGATFSLSVMLGNGDGSFGAAQLTMIAFASTDRICSADLNKDGKDDIVVVHSSSFDVFIGDGDGTFVAAVNHTDGVGIPAAVLVADLDGDTNVDLIVTDGVSVPDSPVPPMVSTFLGNGDGTFAAGFQTTLPGQLSSGIFSDVDGDGLVDLVGSTQVFFGTALGTFQAPVSLTSSNGQPNSCTVQVGAVAVADVNGDTLPDIVTADCQNDTVTVFLNTGARGWLPGISYWAGVYPQGVAVADINGDALPDIIASNADSSNITLIRNLGAGLFQSPDSGYSVGGFGWLNPLIADFDGDSIADVLVANYIPEFQFTLAYLHGFGDASFSSAPNYFARPSPGNFAYGTGIATADFNNDGRRDFVRANAANGGAGISVFVTNSDSTMQAAVSYGASSYNYVQTGDFNNDGKQDIVAVTDSGSLDLFAGNGDGTFALPLSFSALTGVAGGLIVGDFNHDNNPDVAVAGTGQLAVLLNNGAGGFLSPVVYAMTGAAAAMAVADLNADGNLDLVVPLEDSNFTSIFTGNSDGTFQPIADVDLGFNDPHSLVIGDFNGDGKPDLAVTIDDASASMGLDILLGNGNGTFQAGALYASTNLTSPIGPSFPGGVQAADLDGDGNLDLIYDNSEYENVAVMFGQGDGTFLAPLETSIGGYPGELVLADVDGDGSLDVITSMAAFPGITVLLNASGSTMNVISSLNPTLINQLFTLTALVSPGGYHVRGTPTGTVTFTEGATVLGTSTLSGGVAFLGVTETAGGNHTITATYSGDASFLGTTRNFFETVIDIGAGDYTLSANPTSAVLQAGQSASFAITVTPTEGFAGPVSFSCGTLPAGVSCQFTPASVILTNGPQQVQLVVTAAPLEATTNSKPRSSLPLLGSVAAGFFGLFLLDGKAGKRNRATITTLVLLTLSISLGTVGCSGTHGEMPPQVSNSHAVQVVASGAGEAGTHELNLMITIQQ